MATMDEMGLETSPEEDALPLNEESLGQRRRRAREILSTQHLYLDRLEDELGERVRQITDELGRELARDLSSSSSSVDDGRIAALEAQIDDLRQQLSNRQIELRQVRDQQEQAQIDLARLGQDARVGNALLTEAQSEQEKNRLELAATREELADAQAQLAAARAHTEQLRGELALTAERLSAREARMQAQRQRVVRKFKAREAERLAQFDERLARQLAEFERRQSEQAADFDKRQAEQARQFDRQLADQADQFDQREKQHLDEIGRRQADQAAELARRQVEQLTQVDDELTKRVEDTQRLEAELAALRAELDHAKSQQKIAASRQDRAASRAFEEQLQALRSERDALSTKLAAAQASASEHEHTEADATDELHRRLELAVEDLREAKRVNADLEAKLLRKGAASSTASHSSGLNWEAQKERLLASLEADESNDEESLAERHTIEGTIRITDQIVAQKDREIAELTRLVGDASGPKLAATADLLDHDEIIRAEREKLQQFQTEWRQRIGQAEIDISVERAKLARERSELEEKARALQAEQAKRSPDDSSAESAKPQRGRWLARLGLNPDDKS